jgi:hypothetical protein
MELAEFTETMDRFLETDPLSLSDGESIRTLHRYWARCEAWLAQATAAFAASEAWRTSGAQSAAAWLSVEAGLSKADARRTIRLGKALHHLPATEAAWCAGEISAAHVDALNRVRNPGTEEALRRDEAELVGHAKRLRFEAFTKVLAYWAQHADPDGAEARAELQRQRREAYLVPSFEGTWLGRLTFDPVSGAIVDNELRRLTEQFFQADWREATTRLGRDPLVDDLARTSAQRRADAFVEMATRSAAMAPGARRPAPLVSFLVDYDLHPRICELAQGTVVTPGTVLPWLTEAYFERVVMSPPNRTNVSEMSRFFTGALRRTIEVQHLMCQHPYCDKPAVECQVDHIVPYSEGGPTTIENGRLLCEFHNRLAYLDWLKTQHQREDEDQNPLKDQNQRPPPNAA